MKLKSPFQHRTYFNVVEPVPPTPKPSTRGAFRTAFQRSLGIILSVVTMHFLVVRPLVSRLNDLEQQLAQADYGLEGLRQTRDGVLRTSDLLTMLRRQHDELAGARATIRQLQQLRQEIECQAHRIPEAVEAVKRIAELPTLVMETEIEQSSTLLRQAERREATNVRLSRLDERPPVERAIEVKTPADHARRSSADTGIDDALRGLSSVPAVSLWDNDWKMVIRPQRPVPSTTTADSSSADREKPALILSDRPDIYGAIR